MKDVIVIGAGPAGSATAKTIADAGFDVQLIEKRAPLETKTCGGGIPNELANMLSLPEHVVEKRVSYEIHHFPWGRKTYPNKHVTVRREVFDNYLAEQARKSGAELAYQSLAVGVERGEKDQIFVHVKTKKNETFSTLCKIVIFADGAATLARKVFPSVGFQADPHHAAIGAIFEVESKGNTMDHYEIYYGPRVAPWGYGWIFPKKDHLNIGVGCLLSDLKKSRQNIVNILHQFFTKGIYNPERFQEKKVERFGAALIPMAPAQRIYAQSCLVVGDAAGMVDPLLGCGIIHDLFAGRLAGQVAVGALKRHDFSEGYMAKFQALWQQSSHYRQIKRNELITRVTHPLSKFDRNMISKVEWLLFFRRKSPVVENLRAFLFPISNLVFAQ